MRYLLLPILLLLVGFPQASRADAVKVTGTVYKDYARIVFNAPMDDSFTVNVSGDQLVIILPAPINPSFGEALRTLKDYITSARVEGGKQVRIKLKNPKVKLRKFRAEGFFGVDIVPLEKPSTAVAQEKAPKIPVPITPPKVTPKKAVAEATPVPHPQPRPQKKAEKETAAPAPAKPKEKAVPEPKPVAQKTPVPAATTKTDTPAPAVTASGTGGDLARFTFAMRVPAAIYLREHTLWAVFGIAAKIDAPKLIGGNVVAAAQLPDRKYTILRLALRPDLDTRRLWVAREDFDWVVKIGQPPVVTPLPVETTLGDDPSVAVKVLQAMDPLNIVDPDIGDELFVVPVRDPNNLVQPERRYVDMHLLPTLQGVVIRRMSESARFKVDRDAVRITSMRGLKASEVLIREEPEPEPESEPEPEHEPLVQPVEPLSDVSMFHFVADSNATADYMPNYYAKLQAWTTAFAPQAVNAQRLDMAEFFFRQGMYVEALGMLRQVLEDAPQLAAQSRVKEMIAACQFLIGRYDQAADAFAELVQKNEQPDYADEEKLWLWASARMNARENLVPAPAIADFEPAAAFTKYQTAYPLSLRRQFLLLLAEQMLDENRTGLARQFIDSVKQIDPDQENADDVDYIHARALQIERKDNQAIDAYRALIKEAQNQRVRAVAEYALAGLLKDTGKSIIAESITLLERARLEWRGDQLELDILRRLGSYYIETKNYIEGLRAWRTLVSNFPGTTQALEVAADMAKVYIDLFESKEAESLPPVQMLGLFFEFNELMPVGESGDRISRKLAEHLEEADLLESAAAILTHQVRYRSKGADRAALAAKLVALHLVNNRLDLAIEVMTAMAKEQIPDELQPHYRYLRAEMLVREKKYPEALELIAADKTQEANDLKFAIYWYQQQWEKVVGIIEPELRKRALNKEPLNEMEEQEALRLAVAYSRLKRWREMEWLKNAFGGKLKTEEIKNAFEFVSNRSAQVDHNMLDKSLELDRLESFLKQYRKPEPPAPAPAETPAPAEGAAAAAATGTEAAPGKASEAKPSEEKTPSAEGAPAAPATAEPAKGEAAAPAAEPGAEPKKSEEKPAP